MRDEGAAALLGTIAACLVLVVLCLIVYGLVTGAPW